MTRRGLLVRLALLAGAGAGAFWLRDHVLWPPPGVDLPGGRPSGWQAFASQRLVPTLKMTIQGRTVNALIDSGAQRSVIDRSLYQELALPGVFDIPLVAYGVAGRPQMGRGVTFDARLGDVVLTNVRAAILDLGGLAGAEGLNAPVILGQDFLKTVALELDTASRRLRLHPSGSPGPADALEAELRTSRWGLETDVTVEDHAVSALLDTGASALLSVRRSTAQAAGLLDGRPQQATTSLVFGGEIGAIAVPVRTLSAVGHAWGSRLVAVYDESGPLGHPEALLGMEAFRGAEVWLDFGRKKLAVRRAPTVDLSPPA